MTRPMSPGDPDRLGAYELTGRLGEGAQGVVYMGRGPGGAGGRGGAGAQVAVKLLHAQLSGNPAARSRFVRELEVAERVAGFCTAQVLDADIAGDRPYIVSEYVPGPSLREQVEAAGPFDPEALTRLAIGTVTALAAIHRAGIVHRDFKPPNVLMGPEGPRVIDFGVARALDSSSVTLTSQVVGTPAYMAPEQVAGGAIGPYTDMFGWAGTMLYAATGRPPFGADSIPAVMHRILHTDPDLSVLPPALAGLVGACLAKDPARRPGAADVLTQLLGQVGAAKPGAQSGDLLAQGASLATSEIPVLRSFPQPPPPPPPPPPYGAPVPRRGNKAPLLLMIGGAIVAVALVVAGLLFVLRAKDDGTAAAAPPATVKLAFLGALSGESEPVGRPIYNGARLAVTEYNATGPRTKVELVDFDTRGEAAQATTQSERIDAEVAGVIGPGFSGEALSAAPTLGNRRVPMISPAANIASLSTSGGPYWHRIVPGNDKSVRALADLMVRASEVKRVVVVRDENDWTAPDARVATDALTEKGVKVTGLRIQSSANDYTADLDKIKKAGAEAVFYGGYYDPAARFIKQARGKGLKARFFLTDQSLAAGFVELAGRDQAQGTVISCSCFDPSASTLAPAVSFRTRYARMNGGQSPGLYTGEGYDAALAFIEAVKAGRTTREEINGYLRTIDVPGVTRRIGFTAAGDPADDTSYVYVVHKGALTLAGPAKTATLTG